MSDDKKDEQYIDPKVDILLILFISAGYPPAFLLHVTTPLRYHRGRSSHWPG